VQRAAVNSSPINAVPPIVHEVLRSPGQPLDAETRAFMVPRFGYDFGGVRVHTDTRAAESARTVNALAYTVGHDVVFGTGRYTPRTSAGQRLMAHELTHVVQQMATPRTASIGLTRSTYNLSEQEAEQVANTIQTAGPLHIAQNAPQRTLARVEDSEAESTTASGCRKVTETPCPGTRGQLTRIEYFRQMFLVNRGTCPLFVGGLDANGNVINPTQAHFELSPGDSGTFIPPEGSVGVGFACQIDCDGMGLLEHPYLCA